jgi:DNA-binding HxlR family transcriptional regulator
MPCPIARGLEHVGEWWSILILRDALRGCTRFDEFQSRLGIAPNMLAKRLTALVDAGILERRQYSDRPVRHEYLLTAAGKDFLPVAIVLYEWGNKHFPADEQRVVLVHTSSGRRAEPVLMDRRSGKRISSREFGYVPSLAAGRTP